MTHDRVRVVLATHNRHKLEEFAAIIADRMPQVELVEYDGPEPVEDGVTFAENALIKARAAAEHTGLVALADDSGIGVEVLGGAPGVFSARWSGRHGDDAGNLELLLAQLGDVPDEHRGAWYTCAIALVRPTTAGIAGDERTVQGEWPGSLARAPRGSNGFGYDPAFVPSGSTLTAAELDPDVKNADSHRARAFRAMVPVLETLISE
ncbi:RdgB/HAM1 family non-canonical purine NTP pyrophosphatase [Planctomonas sp. JC2975]|uniref:RdgB/HAM1 family non-canonical purine NTP pyrophosphatase n=1 Tax=Planctomonas sp. JC2975 TaxID=2729626 RepID=UPI001474A529|nr:RdgB/HAM1 family non-canonical purine NTP pyrophosphatase [Planctomonas sp. JC2975]NNC11122.1 RdgB/HAM1 family non-canonical purine NTP pyrophosphatase [Planctomonas sp. JC2975]